MSKLSIATGLTLLIYAAAGIAAGDPTRGAQAFQECAMCHSVEPGRHLTGPSLAHVWGKKAASAEGFGRYSEALQRSGVVWNEKTLNQWLTNPQAFVPGNAMAFPGISDAASRTDVIAYLKAVSEGKAPTAQFRGGGMMGGMMDRGMMGGGMMGGGMMGGGGPANLKQVDDASQVVSLHHCRDTYIIKTAAGATQKVWEYNVRLKTDSSNDGPNRGKPVMTDSGMRGDRVSIVFASPAELSQFIKEAWRMNDNEAHAWERNAGFNRQHRSGTQPTGRACAFLINRSNRLWLAPELAGTVPFLRYWCSTLLRPCPTTMPTRSSDWPPSIRL